MEFLILQYWNFIYIFFISIIIAVFLKEKMNKKSEKFVNRMRESGLVGE